ncbi:MAG TPA: TetR/AcrR family transcriptional regulator [Acidimicrobiales bacterium]|nr:TetR/AcrR family transcriptional regulator [Acidimicrobiales bacterium]
MSGSEPNPQTRSLPDEKAQVHSPRLRRTQAERTATTQAALLDATVECLVEKGYSGTTTTEIAHRAAVSPGALVHHFPAKVDLLCAAVGHLFEQRQLEFRKAMANLPPGEDRIDAAIDVLWTLFSGPTFLAWIELWLAARTDPELAKSVVRVDEQFMLASESIIVELFSDEIASDPEFLRLGLRLVYTLLSGLALHRVVPGEDPMAADNVLSVFKGLLKPALSGLAESRSVLLENGTFTPRK